MRDSLIFIFAPIGFILSIFFIVRKEKEGGVRYLALVSAIFSFLIFFIEVQFLRDQSRSVLHRIACFGDTTSRGCVSSDEEAQIESHVEQKRVIGADENKVIVDDTKETVVGENAAAITPDVGPLTSSGQPQRIVPPAPIDPPLPGKSLFDSAAPVGTTDDYPDREFVLADEAQVSQLIGKWCVRGYGKVAEYYKSGRGLAKREPYLEKDKESAVYISQGLQKTIMYLPELRDYVIFRRGSNTATLNNEGLWLNGGGGHGIAKC